MAQVLESLHVVADLAPGAQATWDPALRSAGGVALVPNVVMPLSPTPIRVVSATSSLITVTNDGDSAQTASFRAQQEFSTTTDPAAAGSQMLWQGLGSAAVAPGGIPAYALSSLVPRDWLAPLWSLQYPAEAPLNGPGATADGSYLDSVILNIDGAAPSGAIPNASRTGWTYIAPPGVTRVRFTVKARNPVGISGQTLTMYLTEVNTTAIATLNAALTNTPTDYSVEGNVAPGTRYVVFVFFNSVSFPQQKLLVGDPRVTVVTGGTGVFAGPFYRYDALPGLFFDNLYQNVSQSIAGTFPGDEIIPRYFAAGMSRIEATTVAESLAFEYQNNETDAAQPQEGRDIYLYVDSKFWGRATIALGPSVGIATVTGLPAGKKVIEIQLNPSVMKTATPPPATVPLPGCPQDGPDFVPMVAIRAIYSPAPIEFTQTLRRPRKVLLVGDANGISTGITSGNAPAKNTFGLVRREVMQQAEVWIHCQEFMESWSFIRDLGHRTQYIEMVRQAGITDVYFSIMFFDWYYAANGTGTYGWANLAAFSAAWGAFLDALHAACPALKIVVQSGLITDPTWEANVNPNGDTQAAYRTAMATVCGTRAFTTYVNGATLIGAWSATYFTNQTQLNEAGSALFARAIRAQLALL